MPDLGTIAECANCAKRAQFTLNGNKKTLPEGWRLLPKTSSGDAIFCSDDCRDGWTSTREWRSLADEMVIEELRATAPSAEPEEEAKPRQRKPRKTT